MTGDECVCNSLKCSVCAVCNSQACSVLSVFLASHLPAQLLAQTINLLGESLDHQVNDSVSV